MTLKKNLLTLTMWIGITGLSGAFMLFAGFYLYLSPKLPSVESIRDYRLQTPLRVYTADEKLIGVFGEKRRKPITFDEIPKPFLDALIAAEDEDFYTHKGVSIRGLARAAYQLIRTGRKGSGGSTLTMQLTRHTFLTLKQTFSRKFNEILLALRIEKELSKQEILELYVNLMYLGKRAYGIEAAAEVYYGKSINELSLAQHAMLVGVFKGPSVQNPITNPDKALERRNYVLARMRKLEYISQEEFDHAVSQPVSADYHGNKIEVDAPYVAEMARKEAIDLFGTRAYADGYRVYTTVNSKLQERAKLAIANGLMLYDGRHGYRGPEQQFSLDDAPTIEQENAATSALDEQTEANSTVEQEPLGEEHDVRDYASWIEALSAIPTYGNLVPAAVTKIDENSIAVIDKNGDSITIDWENGLSSARSYLTENARGPKPKLASDVVQLGDVIRIKRSPEGAWRFSQIPAAQASLVSLNPEDGAILALIGGFDFRHSNFNRATQAQRQPGSNFKPFIYTAALENGLTPATMINDAPIVFDDKQLENTWRPVNDSKKFYGPTRLREALYRSINLVSIRVLERIGIANAIDSLERFGFSRDTLPKDLSLALGSHSATPIEVASGYAVFANGGYRVEPYLVTKIEDFDKNIVFHATPNTVCRDCEVAEGLEILDEELEASVLPEDNEYNIEDVFELSFLTKRDLGLLSPTDYPKAPKVISDQVAFIIDSMLKDVVKRGTGYKAWQRFKRPDLGGKTGTTNGPIDAWFSGYHPNVVTSTWVGFDQNTPLGNREYGGTAALPIWMDFMELALAEIPKVNRAQPSGVVSVRIDPETGMRAKVGDPDAIFEIFRTENVPEMNDSGEITPWSNEESINEELF